MKTGILSTVIMLLFVSAVNVFSQEDPEENIAASFVDTNFLAEVYKIIEKSAGEPIYKSDVAEITDLNLLLKQIENLAGIEHFKALQNLDVSYNNLTSLDLSQNTELSFLSVGNNKLTTLDLSENRKIKRLYVNNNYFASESDIIGIRLTKSSDFLFMMQNQKPPTDSIVEQILKSINLTAHDCFFPEIDGIEFLLNTGKTWKANFQIGRLVLNDSNTVVQVRYAPTQTHYGSESVSISVKEINDEILKRTSITSENLFRREIQVRAMTNRIIIHNLPAETQVKVYNLQGKQIHGKSSGLLQTMEIPVETKGVFLVKAKNQSFKVTVP